MYDDYFVVRNYGKLSANLLLDTSTVIENVGLLSYFLFLTQTTVRTCLNVSFELSVSDGYSRNPRIRTYNLRHQSGLVFN